MVAPSNTADPDGQVIIRFVGEQRRPLFQQEVVTELASQLPPDKARLLIRDLLEQGALARDVFCHVVCRDGPAGGIYGGDHGYTRQVLPLN